MAQKKLADKYVRKLMKTGRSGASFGLTLPKELVMSLGWREKQRIIVKRISGGLIIRDYKNRG